MPRRFAGLRGVLAVAAFTSMGSAAGALAQGDAACRADSTTTVLRSANPLPGTTLTAGEQLHFDVSFGRLHVGSAVMRLVGNDTVDGHETAHAVLVISGGFWKFSVHDSTASWFDPQTFTSRRFVQELRDPGYRASRYYDISPERLTFQQRGKPAMPSVAAPMDDVSFIYFVRSLALEPGQCYELPRYFRPDGNPVVIRVLGRDTVKVPAGTFPAIRLQPEITTSAIFSDKGHAEIWISDDSARVVLQLKAKLSFGSINLYLKSVEVPPLPR